MIFVVSHLEISGNDFNKLQPEKRQQILLTLLVSHFDISGNDINELH